MSAVRDLLEVLNYRMDREKQDPMMKYLLRHIKKLEGDDKKKKEKEKKDWSIEDRICLGLLMAFLAIPLSALYLWVLKSLH